MTAPCKEGQEDCPVVPDDELEEPDACNYNEPCIPDCGPFDNGVENGEDDTIPPGGPDSPIKFPPDEDTDDPYEPNDFPPKELCDGWYDDDGICIHPNPCPPGSHWDPQDKECKTDCLTGTHWDSQDEECKTDEEGDDEEDDNGDGWGKPGDFKPPQICEAGTTWNGITQECEKDEDTEDETDDDEDRPRKKIRCDDFEGPELERCEEYNEHCIGCDEADEPIPGPPDHEPEGGCIPPLEWDYNTRECVEPPVVPGDSEDDEPPPEVDTEPDNTEPVPGDSEDEETECAEHQFLNVVTLECKDRCTPDPHRWNPVTQSCDPVVTVPVPAPAPAPAPDCPEGEIYDDDLGCVCPPGKERNPATGRCVGPCLSGTVRNPITGLCDDEDQVDPYEPPDTDPGNDDGGTVICEDYEVFDGFACICPPGKVRNPITGLCDDPPEDEEEPPPEDDVPDGPAKIEDCDNCDVHLQLAKDTFAAINVYRGTLGQQPLLWNDMLYNSCLAHAKFLCNERGGVIDHAGEGGSNPGQRAMNAGYKTNGSVLQAPWIDDTGKEWPIGTFNYVYESIDQGQSTPWTDTAGERHSFTTGEVTAQRFTEDWEHEATMSDENIADGAVAWVGCVGVYNSGAYQRLAANPADTQYFPQP